MLLFLTTMARPARTRARLSPGSAAEFGRLDGKAVPSLAGVAPFTRDSRLMNCRRAIWGGRKPMRAVLDTTTVPAAPTSRPRIGPSAMVAARHDRTIRVFHERLRAGGKATKLAITARMRKLLVIVNAMLSSLHRGGQPRPLDRSRQSLTPLALMLEEGDLAQKA
jgi:hypothetical protein